MSFEPVVGDDHFAYLALQKGSLDHLKGDREAWRVAYRDSLLEQFASVKPFLPKNVTSILDVGSGLGGIDILLSRHFGDHPRICLLDGIDDHPVMTRHAVTFSNSHVAFRFLRENGVKGDLVAIAPEVGEPVSCELVVSFGSWCFHYPPELYLDFVDQCCCFGAVLILDVRKDRPAWLAMLQKKYRQIAVAHHGRKYSRRVFRVEQ